MKPKKASFKRLANKLNQLQHDNSNSYMITIIKNEIDQRIIAHRAINAWLDDK